MNGVLQKNPSRCHVFFIYLSPPSPLARNICVAWHSERKIHRREVLEVLEGLLLNGKTPERPLFQSGFWHGNSQNNDHYKGFGNCFEYKLLKSWMEFQGKIFFWWSVWLPEELTFWWNVCPFSLLKSMQAWVCAIHDKPTGPKRTVVHQKFNGTLPKDP